METHFHVLKKYFIIGAAVTLLAGCATSTKKDSKEESSSKANQKTTYEPIIPSTPNPDDYTPELEISDEPQKFGTAQSTEPITVDGTSQADVCKTVAGYIQQQIPEYTGIPTDYPSDGNSKHKWIITDLSKYASENPNYQNLSRWSTEADDPYPDDPSKTYPYITAMVENTGSSFIIHRLSMGSTVFLDDDYIPEDSLSK